MSYRLWHAANVRDPAAPFVTFYDGATGERVELSTTTFNNWVAKTANLLRDEMDLTAGDRVGLTLPLHWLTPVWTAATWAVGATLVVNPRASAQSELAILVVGPDDVLVAGDSAAASTSAEIIACSLRPMATGFQAPLPQGVMDYAVEVRAHGDHFSGHAGLPSGQPVLVIGTQELTQPAVAEHAAELARRWDLHVQGRLLVESTITPGLEHTLAAYSVPQAVFGSVVIVRNAGTRLNHLAEQELVSATATFSA